MKTERRQSGVIAWFVGAFTRNWILKLLSLALAILIFNALKPQDDLHPKTNDQPFFHY